MISHRHLLHRILTLMLLFAVISSSGWSAEWMVGNSGIPGVYGSVTALVNTTSGKLFAAGGFSIAGNQRPNNIAQWDPNSNEGAGAWTTLGSGMDAEVYALALDKTGNLYAGGYFTTAGGVAANHVAKWNPTTRKWSALGTGSNNGVGGLVKTLACDASGNLYAGGSFTTAGGANANYIAKWNGTAWVTLGTGGSNGVGLDVNALAFDAAGNLYVGGWFETAGGKPAAYLAVWNPKANSGAGAWSALPNQVSNTVHALAFDTAGMLYVGGAFMMAGTVDAYYIAKWNPSTQQWSALGNGYGIYNTVTSLVCDKSGNLYAGGFFSSVGEVTDAKYVAKWNPAANGGNGAWSSLGTGMDAPVNALSLDASGNLYTGGNFGNAGGIVAEKNREMDGHDPTVVGLGQRDERRRSRPDL